MIIDSQTQDLQKLLCNIRKLTSWWQGFAFAQKGDKSFDSGTSAFTDGLESIQNFADFIEVSISSDKTVIALSDICEKAASKSKVNFSCFYTENAGFRFVYFKFNSESIQYQLPLLHVPETFYDDLTWCIKSCKK